MTQYEMPSRSPYRGPFRVIAGISISLLLVILFIAVWPPAELGDGARRALVWLAAAIVVLGVVGGNWIGTKESFWKLKRTYRVEVTDGKLLQRRLEAPDVEIAVNEIASIRQSRGGWLIVRGGEPERQVAIPPEIVGFENLKQEIVGNHAIQPLKITTSVWIFLPPLSAVVAVFVFFASHSRVLVMAAGGALLLLQALGMLELRRNMRSNPKANIVTIVCFLAFLLTCWVVYERVTSRF